MAIPDDNIEEDRQIQGDQHAPEISRFRSVVMDILAHPKKLRPAEIVKLLPSDNRFTFTLKSLFDKDDKECQ